MRPFFGIRNILISSRTIVLLSHPSMEKSDSLMINWTLYHLELPDDCNFFRIFENLASNCQQEDIKFFTNYYFHMITEAHIILGIIKDFAFIEIDENLQGENTIKLAKLNFETLREIDELLKQSNCNLGDFYLS